MAPPRASAQASQGRPMDAPAFLASLNLPPGMLTTCRRRARRFPGGGQYRVEIPSRSRARRRLRRWSRRPRNTAFPCTASAPVPHGSRSARRGGLPHTPSDSQCCSHGKSLTELLEPCSAATCLGRLVRKSLWLSSLPSAAIPGSGCGTGPAGRGRAGGSTSSMAAGYIRASTRLNEQRWESPAGLAAP